MGAKSKVSEEWGTVHSKDIDILAITSRGRSVMIPLQFEWGKAAGKSPAAEKLPEGLLRARSQQGIRKFPGRRKNAGIAWQAAGRKNPSVMEGRSGQSGVRQWGKALPLRSFLRGFYGHDLSKESVKSGHLGTRTKISAHGQDM